MYSIMKNSNNFNNNNKKSNTLFQTSINSKETLIPKVYSIQDYYHWKNVGKRGETKVKITINNPIST